MGKALRDARAEKICGMAVRMTSKLSGGLEIAGGIALAIAAEPIHEAGHAVAARMFTGAWPRFGLWAVHPTGQFESAGAILAVLVAGDAAVIGWWALVYLIARRRPEHRWALIGPTFMAGLALLNWFAVPLLAPFGQSGWGASDAVKFMSISGLPWYVLAVCVAVAALAVMVPSVKCLAAETAAERSFVARSWRSPG